MVRDFIIGIISSLAATALAIMTGFLHSAKPRGLLLRMLSRITGIGIVRTYPQQKIASTDLEADLKKARWVRVLAGRGNELTRDNFQVLWQRQQERLESVRVLLPDPADRGGWLRIREEEIRTADAGFEQGLLAKQVAANVDYVSAIAARTPEVELRLYDAPHQCRIVATDAVAYFTPYGMSTHGRHSPCLVFRSGSVMYEHALQIFARLWRAGE